MRILTYQGLDTHRLEKPLARIRAAIAREDFRAAGIRKLAPTPYWRAKLDDKSRLLMQFVRHGGETVCLFLEIIDNHAYEKSRFLRGARVDVGKVEETGDVASADALVQVPETAERARHLAACAEGRGLPPQSIAAQEHWRALADWLGRYGPARNVEGEDGAWVDITGVPQLLGGEETLAGDLQH